MHEYEMVEEQTYVLIDARGCLLSIDCDGEYVMVLYWPTKEEAEGYLQEDLRSDLRPLYRVARIDGPVSEYLRIGEMAEADNQGGETAIPTSAIAEPEASDKGESIAQKAIEYLRENGLTITQGWVINGDPPADIANYLDGMISGCFPSDEDEVEEQVIEFIERELE